ncbi:cupin 2 domain-containing protein [Sphingomonas zeicaulis]|uniref:cupin domain-containing protein n=1 Tax=Sphingomonas zeicaulis TaxID=1632740 RepID=UPI003D213356
MSGAGGEAERFEALLSRPDVLIERIVSNGHTTPPDQPYLQSHDEWVMIVSGAARVLVEGQPERSLAPGEYMLVPGGAKHWVTWTAEHQPTVWLAVHLLG